jgi:hypothetical protein
MLPVGALRFQKTAHFTALISPSPARQLGIALCGKSLIVSDIEQTVGAGNIS